MWQIENITSQLWKCYGHQIWQGGNLPWGAHTHKVIWSFDHVVFWDQVTNLNYYISISRMPLTTKLSKMLDYIELLPPIESHKPSMMWSCKITWQTRSIISPLPQCLWPPNLVGWWLTLRFSYTWSQKTLSTRAFKKLCDKLKPLYLHYHNAYGYQIWQNSDLPWRIPTHKVIWYFVSWSCEITWQIKPIISPLT